MGFTKIRNIRLNRRKNALEKHRVYRRVDTIPAFNFFEIQKTNDLRWLVIGYDGFKDIPVPDDAIDIYSELINEYCALTGNNRTAQYYDLMVHIAELEMRSITVKALLDCFRPPVSKKTYKEIVDELHGWGFLFNTSADHDKELSRMQAQLRGATTKLNIKRKELETLMSDQGTSDILKVKVILEQILHRSYIDLKKITLKEWIFISEQAEQVSKANRKAANKR